jgi:hypothetical protein
MEVQDVSTTQDKQITVDVPEDRVAEFYAFYARFLAGRRRNRDRGESRHGHRHGHGRGCREHRGERLEEQITDAVPEA